MEQAAYISIAPKAPDNWIACGPPEAKVKAPDPTTIQALGVLLVTDPNVDYSVPDNTETRYRVLTFPDVPGAEEGVAFFRTTPSEEGTSIGVAALTRTAQRGTKGVHRVQVALTDTDQYAVGVVFAPSVSPSEYYSANPLPTTATDVYSRQTLEGAALRRQLFGDRIGEC